VFGYLISPSLSRREHRSSLRAQASLAAPEIRHEADRRSHRGHHPGDSTNDRPQYWAHRLTIAGMTLKVNLLGVPGEIRRRAVSNRRLMARAFNKGQLRLVEKLGPHPGQSGLDRPSSKRWRTKGPR
jgi:hypothetical protein